MHEISLMERLFEILDEIIIKNSINKVNSITVSAGEMRQIIPESFKFAFDSLKKNTIYEEADFIMEFIPIKIRCTNCSRESNIKDNIYICPYCSSIDTVVIKGDEIIIKSIDGEK